MTNREMLNYAKTLPKTQALFRIAGHDYIMTFKTELYALAAKQNVQDGYITNLNQLYSYEIVNIHEVFSIKRYFIVNGVDHGKPVIPYMIETLGNVPKFGKDIYCCVEDIGRSQVIENLKRGMALKEQYEPEEVSK